MQQTESQQQAMVGRYDVKLVCTWYIMYWYVCTCHYHDAQTRGVFDPILGPSTREEMHRAQVSLSAPGQGGGGADATGSH